METQVHPVRFRRPERAKIEQLKEIGSATLSAELKHKAGIRNSHIVGPVTQEKGRVIGGPAITLQFMPIREDYYEDKSEYQEVEKQLHRHALYLAEAGDIVVVDARADMQSGVFGEMMLTYLQGKRGEGIVIDGVVRDSQPALETGLGMWVRGFTPNYHIQTGIFPFSVNCPIACGGRLVFPGDIIIADDDGVVVVPLQLVDDIIAHAGTHKDWEVFSKLRLSEGGDLRKYYPLTEEAQQEFEEWKKTHKSGV